MLKAGEKIKYCHLGSSISSIDLSSSTAGNSRNKGRNVDVNSRNGEKIQKASRNLTRPMALSSAKASFLLHFAVQKGHESGQRAKFSSTGDAGTGEERRRAASSFSLFPSSPVFLFSFLSSLLRLLFDSHLCSQRRRENRCGMTV